MPESGSGQLTRLLDAAREGSADAATQVLELVYGELRQVAAQRLSGRRALNTLQPTALVHEVWLRLMGDAKPHWQNRRHFFAAAARSMRDILVERARAAATVKRGGDRRRVDIDQAELPADDQAEHLLALDEALSRLEQAAPLAAQVVMLRFFTGLTVNETAAALETSASSVDRHWAWAKAWLHREMGKGSEP